MSHLQVPQRSRNGGVAPEYAGYGPGEGGTGGQYSGAASVVSGYSGRLNASEMNDAKSETGSIMAEMGLGRRQYKSSQKAQSLVQEIDELESRAAYLLERNKWLSSKMMNLQKSVVGKSIGTMGKSSLKRTFRAWREAMSELRLEHHLDMQTKSLVECKEVAEELGRELRNEQELVAQMEVRRECARQQLVEVQASVGELEKKLAEQESDTALMEHKLHTVEDFVARKRNHANTAVEEGVKYDRRKRDLEMHFRDKAEIEQEQKLLDPRRTREEARDTIDNVRGLLPQQGGSPASGLASRSSPKGSDWGAQRRQAREYEERDQGPSISMQNGSTNQLFNEIDADGDGVITREEFERAKTNGVLNRARMVQEAAEMVPNPPQLGHSHSGRMPWQGEGGQLTPVHHMPVTPQHFPRDHGHQLVQAVPAGAYVQRPAMAYPSGGQSPAYHGVPVVHAQVVPATGGMPEEDPWWRQRVAVGHPQITTM